MQRSEYDALLAAARVRDDLLSLAFAGAISRALAENRRPIIRGLSEGRFRRLLNEYFPEVEIGNGDCDALKPDASRFAGFVETLLQHRREPTEQRAWLSYAIASAAMEAGPLWNQLGLPTELLLDDLMLENFPALAARNASGVEWKAFLGEID